MKRASLTLRGNQYWQESFPFFISREREAFSLPVHDHDFIEIHYVAEGFGYHYIGDPNDGEKAEKRLQVSKGDLFIVPVGVRHVYRPRSQAAKDELIVYNCLFAVSLLQRLIRSAAVPDELQALLTGGTPHAPFRRYVDSLREGRSYMEAMLREYRLPLLGREAVLQALLTQLLVYLLRLDAQQLQTSSAPYRLGLLQMYLEERLGEQPTLREASAKLQLGVGQIQQLLKASTGQTFTEYLQNLRIRKSQELLLQGDLTVKAVAAMVGYRDLKFFYHLFRKKTGLSPGRYRRS